MRGRVVLCLIIHSIWYQNNTRKQTNTMTHMEQNTSIIIKAQGVDNVIQFVKYRKLSNRKSRDTCTVHLFIYLVSRTSVWRGCPGTLPVTAAHWRYWGTAAAEDCRADWWWRRRRSQNPQTPPSAAGVTASTPEHYTHVTHSLHHPRSKSD